MGNKYDDIRWKWLAERGFNVLADKHQYAYAQSLFASPDVVTGVFCDAKAGTGKTTIATLIGAYEVERGNYDRIIYVRNAVPVRDIGFLPGGIGEKELPYMLPFIEALDHVQPGLFEKWSCQQEDGKNKDKETPKVQVTTSAYSRGITWNNAFIIIDEFQSFDLNEAQTVLTRPTDNCKVVVIGSTRQNDNPKNKINGMTPFEIYMRHFQGYPVAFHKLETNYRGWLSTRADEIHETIEKLKSEEIS